MDRLLRNVYNDEFSNSNRDLEIDGDVNVDVGVDTNDDTDMIGSFDTANSHNFEANTFEGDEWIRQLQQQQADVSIGKGEAALNGPQQQQFRLPYEQDVSLSIPSPVKNNNYSSHNDVDRSKQSHEMNQIQPQEQQSQPQLLMPDIQGLGGLQHLQGVDNATSLNLILQQQQQQQQFSNISNNSNQAIDASIGTLQLLEQDLATITQQQQNHQPQHASQVQQNQALQHESQVQQNQPPQQLGDRKLQEQLYQLQHLQQQQQEILKNIGHTTVVDPNSLLNPIGSILNTLMGQLNSNIITNTNGSNMGGNSNAMINNGTILGQNSNRAFTLGQTGETQQLQINNGFLSQAGLLPSVQPQIQQQQQPQVGFMGTNDSQLEAQQQQQQQQVQMLQVQRAKVDEGRPPPDGNNAFDSFSSHLDNSSKTNGINNINSEFSINHPPPAAKKSDKRTKQKSFPNQLWDAMMAEGPSNDAAFEWLPDGKSFVVVDPNLFCAVILDRKFKQSKYGSFVRKLHRWGFIRLTSGTGTDCFHHPLFQKSKPELVTEIKCNSRNGKDGKKGHNAFASAEVKGSVQPSLMGVEKFIRAKVVATETENFRT